LSKKEQKSHQPPKLVPSRPEAGPNLGDPKATLDNYKVANHDGVTASLGRDTLQKNLHYCGATGVKDLLNNTPAIVARM